MKKYFVAAVAVMAVLAIALPASAKVEFSYGGLFRARIISQGDFTYTPNFGAVGFDGESYYQSVSQNRDEDTLNRLDQRLRLYFDFIASENLRLVTKFEANEVWGNSATGGKIGADHPNDFLVKNAYLDFNIPNVGVPLRAKVGIQTIAIYDSWVIDDDFSSANLTAKFDAFTVMAGYASGQNNDVFDEKENIDDWFMKVDYVCGPWSASVLGFYQDGNDTVASADPSYHLAGTPAGVSIPTEFPATSFEVNAPRNFFQRSFMLGANSFYPGDSWVKVSNNDLVDIGLAVKYKSDWLSAYLTFIMNLGSVEFFVFDNDTNRSLYSQEMDYEGWMIDVGGSYFCGPFTFNLGGFYTTGPDDIADSMTPVNAGHVTGTRYLGRKSGDISWFTYPLHTTKYFSEIIGGGILDNVAPQHEDYQWRGYQAPTNLWTLNLGAAWQVLPSTKLSFSYWYFGTSEDVVSGPRGDYATHLSNNGFMTDYFNGYLTKDDVSWDSEIGHEFDLGITHKIVDGLTLDLVAAYLIAGDAYSMNSDDDDALELGARLQWSF